MLGGVIVTQLVRRLMSCSHRLRRKLHDIPQNVVQLCPVPGVVGTALKAEILSSVAYPIHVLFILLLFEVVDAFEVGAQSFIKLDILRARGEQVPRVEIILVGWCLCLQWHGPNNRSGGDE